MIFIATALYQEAEPIIKEYGLKKVTDASFNIFENEHISLIVTGTGLVNMAINLTHLLTARKASTADFVVNIGCCAGKEEGKLFYINKITDLCFNRTYYPDVLYSHNIDEKEIYTGNEVITSEMGYELYDMEAAAVYQAAIKFVPTANIIILKAVSDNFKGSSVSPEAITELISKCIPQLDEIINMLENLTDNYGQQKLSDEKIKEYAYKLAEDFSCSVNMKNQLVQLIKYAALSEIDYEAIVSRMYENEILPCKTKKEGMTAIEYLKSQIL